MQYILMYLALLWAFVGHSEATIETCQAMGLYFCSECENTDLQCDACTVGYTVKSNKTGCLKCTDTNCLQCSIKVDDDTQTDCQVCAAGYYLNDADKTCAACDATCSNCTDTNCLVCKETTDVVSGADPKTCATCPANCKTCVTGDTTTPTKCTACNDGYFVENDACTECTDTNCLQCVVNADDNTKTDCQVCADGYYVVDTDKTCGTCSDTNCLQCAVNADDSNQIDCQVCADGYYVVDTDKTCAACDATCSNCTDTNCLVCKETTDVVSGADPKTCATCPANCKTCVTGDTTTPAKCTACNDGYFVENDACTACTDTNCLQCVVNADDSNQIDCQVCADGYYVVDTDKTCAACDATCSNCTDTNCLVCKETTYVVSGADPKTCATCPANCKTCVTGDTTTPTKCTACNDGYFVENDACTACPVNCDECSGTSNCTKCSAGYGLASTGICQDCATLTGVQNCASCIDATVDTTAKCESCTTGYTISYNAKECLSIASFGVECTEASDKPPSCTLCQDGVGAELVSNKCLINCYVCGSLDSNVPTTDVAQCNAQGTVYIDKQQCEYGCSIAVKYENNEMVYAARGCVVNATCLSDGVEQCTDVGPSQNCFKCCDSGELCNGDYWDPSLAPTSHVISVVMLLVAILTAYVIN